MTAFNSIPYDTQDQIVTERSTKSLALFSLSELSQRTEVPINILRYFESMNLLSGVQVTTGSIAYDAYSVRQVHFIRRAQKAGLSLDELGQIIRSAREPANSDHTIRDLLQRKLADIALRMLELEQMQRFLKSQLAQFEKGDVIA